MNVILINGPMGAGKTTVGKQIAESVYGTALIDGDWCMDLHPFVGSRETKEMAIDNILHMMRNYKACSACRQIVLVWLMDEAWVRNALADGICKMGLTPHSFTLMCSEEELIRRWKNDDRCDWRTDEWLRVSLRSLKDFSNMENCIDTTAMTIAQVTETVMNRITK